MFKIIEQLQLTFHFGRCLIKHRRSIQRFITISLIASLFEKLYSSINNLSGLSTLPIYLYNCSTTILSKNESIVKCANSSEPLKISDLDFNLTKQYAAELNSYIYDNSLVEQIIMYVTYVFVAFLLFILIHFGFERCNIYKSDLELASFEQNLYLIDFTQQSIHNFVYSIKEKSEFKEFAVNYDRNRTSNKKRQYLNHLWTPLYSLFKKNELQKVVDSFRKSLDSNEDNSDQARVLAELGQITDILK
jgi:hypothetical protein